MVEWIFTAVFLVVVMGMRLKRIPFNTMLAWLELFIWMSTINATLAFLEIYDYSRVVDIQLGIEIIFITSILMQIFTGSFSWKLYGVSVIFIAMLFFAVFGVTALFFKNSLPPEISLAIVYSVLSYSLIFRLMSRVRRFVQDYRFWLVTGVAMYYMFGLIAFYTEWAFRDIAPDLLWHIHEFGFVLATLCFLGSCFEWYKTRGTKMTNEERFLLPNWLLKRLLYFFENDPHIAGLKIN